MTTVELTLRAFLLPYADHFRRAGWRVDALARGATHSRTIAPHFDELYEASWSRAPLHPRNLTRAISRCRDVILAGGYDLVHVHTPVAAFCARLAVARLAPSRRPAVVYTAHGFHFFEGAPPISAAVFRMAERLAARWSDGLIVINEEDHGAAQRLRLAPSDRLWHLPGVGIDYMAMGDGRSRREDDTRLRSEFGIPPGAAILLFAAEFNRGKKQRHAIEALAKLRRTDIHLICAGTGPRLDEARRLAAAVGVGTQVHFPGFRTDIPQLMRASRAVLLLSEREGLPRSVQEAMAIGVPVIGTRVRGIRDLIGDGGGILVAVGDVDAAARAIARVIDESDLAHRLAAEGRRRSAAYDIGALLRRHEAIYEAILQRSGLLR